MATNLDIQLSFTRVNNWKVDENIVNITLIKLTHLFQLAQLEAKLLDAIVEIEFSSNGLHWSVERDWDHNQLVDELDQCWKRILNDARNAF